MIWVWHFAASVLFTGILNYQYDANTDKLLGILKPVLTEGSVEGAMEVAKSTPGPAAVFSPHEGLRNARKGPDAVEKAIVSYGSVQMGMLAKGLVWIALFIAGCAMLGFWER